MTIIHTTADSFLEVAAQQTAGTPAVMKEALLVSPEGFGLSEQSAADNPYMTTGLPLDLDKASRQHEALVSKLEELGVKTRIFSGIAGHDDGVFPNNVFATTPGRLVIGAMRHPVRRKEAEREDIRSFFSETLGYEIRDLSAEDCVAELTGPLVIDRARNIGFCGMSSRVDEAGCAFMADALGLEAVLRFQLAPGEYHANLVLAVLAGEACLVHPESTPDPFLLKSLRSIYENRLLVLDQAEKNSFAGNCITATRRDLLFSRTAATALRRETRLKLDEWGFRLHFLEVEEFEKAGGSVRCLVAEIY